MGPAGAAGLPRRRQPLVEAATAGRRLGPFDLFERVPATGKRSITMQRCKGLDEINPAQLWDPAEVADTVFETLRGTWWSRATTSSRATP